MTVIVSAEKLTLGKVYPVMDKYTNKEARMYVIREATEKEYLESDPPEVPSLLGNYYEVSFD
jgi:hypothetical protein